MEKAVVNEQVVGDLVFRDTPDSAIEVRPLAKSTRGTQYGTLAFINGEVTEEKVNTAKKMVVDDVCSIIREIADKCDDFFIVKEIGGNTSVACKFVLPTVDEYPDLDARDELIVE